MKQMKTLKKSNEEEKKPLSKSSPSYPENILTPVILSGVVMPWTKILGNGRVSDFKLVCSNGFEYFILADTEWSHLLRLYSWEEVQVKGLLNMANMTVIPQKVFPKGPTGELENVIDLGTWKSREFVKKLAKGVNELVLIPAAVFAVMAAAR